jgi:cell division protein FtsA
LKKNQKNYFYALDIGSKKLTLAAMAEDRAGHSDPIMVETQAAKGIFKGVVNDLAALSDAVEEIFKKMEARNNIKATKVALSINGNYVEARHSVTAIALSERGTRSITRRDIDRLNLQARNLGLNLDEHLLHEYPQGYSVDRHNMTLNPLGLHGRKFEMDLLLVSAPVGYIDNITKAVEQAGLDVTNIVFSGTAAGEAVLTSEDKEKGAVLVDIGDALTCVLIFKDGVARRLNIISFGGKNLDEIISNYCKIPLALADEVKKSSVEINRDISETEEVMIKTEDDYRSVKKKELVLAIQPEVDKFVAMLKSVIFESGIPGIAGVRVVVTGGLSLLEGFLEKMEHDLGLVVKMGIIKKAGNLPFSQAPAYAAAIGLLHSQRDSYQEMGLKLQAQGKNKITQVIDYISNLYQDYF